MAWETYTGKARRHQGPYLSDAWLTLVDIGYLRRLHPPTDEEMAEACLSAQAEGITATEMAKLLGINLQQVHEYLRRNG